MRRTPCIEFVQKLGPETRRVRHRTIRQLPQAPPQPRFRCRHIMFCRGNRALNRDMASSSGTALRLAALIGVDATLDLLGPRLLDLGIGLPVGEDQQLVHEVRLLLGRELADLLGEFLHALVHAEIIARLRSIRTLRARAAAWHCARAHAGSASASRCSGQDGRARLARLVGPSRAAEPPATGEKWPTRKVSSPTGAPSTPATATTSAT